jgi:hypothetical protein
MSSMEMRLPVLPMDLPSILGLILGGVEKLPNVVKSRLSVATSSQMSRLLSNDDGPTFPTMN